jgi:hypothetical protein
MKETPYKEFDNIWVMGFLVGITKQYKILELKQSPMSSYVYTYDKR